MYVNFQQRVQYYFKHSQLEDSAAPPGDVEAGWVRATQVGPNDCSSDAVSASRDFGIVSVFLHHRVFDHFLNMNIVTPTENAMLTPAVIHPEW